MEYVAKACVWLFGTVPISHLDWDPKEWDWKKVGPLKACNFYEYTTKMGIPHRLPSNERFPGPHPARILISAKETSHPKNLALLVP